MKAVPLRVALVACCKNKLPTRAYAESLYTSPLFRLSRAVARAESDRWYVLSALHGLVKPNTAIDPYDQTLLTMSLAERDSWGRKVVDQLRTVRKWSGPMVLTAYAGSLYVEPFVAAGIPVRQPLAGMGIGQRLKWLSERVKSHQTGLGVFE